MEWESNAYLVRGVFVYEFVSEFKKKDTVGICQLEGGRLEDECPRVDLLSKDRWRSVAEFRVVMPAVWYSVIATSHFVLPFLLNLKSRGETVIVCLIRSAKQTRR
jgi:hypothetical protein